MTLSVMLSSIATVVTMIAFLGIVWWAYGLRRKRDFDAAANAPFALPEEAPEARRATTFEGERG